MASLAQAGSACPASKGLDFLFAFAEFRELAAESSGSLAQRVREVVGKNRQQAQ